MASCPQVNTPSFHNPYCHPALLTQKRGRWMGTLMPAWRRLQTGKRPECLVCWPWFLGTQRREEEKGLTQAFKALVDSHWAVPTKVTKRHLAHQRACTEDARCCLLCWYFECLCFSLYSILRLCPKAGCCSVAQSCPALCDRMDRSPPGLPVFHHLLELAQTHVHRVSDVIQPSHPLSPLSPPALNLSQHQSLFLWVQKAWYPLANFQPAEQPFSRFKKNRKSQIRWWCSLRMWKRRQGFSLHEGPQDLSGLGKRNVGSPNLDMFTRHMDSEVVVVVLIFIYLDTSCLHWIMWDLSLVNPPPQVHRLSCFGACEILAPLPGIKPTSTASEDGFLTTTLPGKSQFWSSMIKQQIKWIFTSPSWFLIYKVNY